MKRSLAFSAALVLGVTAGAGTSAAFASWQVQATIAGATITAGSIHFAVDDPRDLPTAQKSSGASDGSVTWKLPDGAQTAVVQIDAQSQGNRGLEYTLDSVDIAGFPGIAAAARVSIITVPKPADCVSGVADSVAEPLYSGKLSSAKLLDPRELVTADYTDAPWTEPETEYLCLDIWVQPGLGEEVSTATVSGTAAGGLETDREVSARDEVSVRRVPATAAQDAVVELTFSYETYRAGGL